MIAFVSLFLGLVVGPQVIEVAVAERVAVVELLLDGEPLGRIEGEPWRTEVDLGGEPMPHELVAVARDRRGVELGRAVQRLNVPRSAIEAEILLGGWRAGRPAWARLVWRSRRFLEPQAIAASLDGSALEVVDPRRIALPPVDPRSIHFIGAELTFPGNQRVAVQAIFGGRYGEEVESRLTAVPVLLDRRRLERPGEAAGWLRRRSGEPLPVVAVEDDAARLYVVRDEAALPQLDWLRNRLRQQRGEAYKRLGLVEEDRVFLMSARAVVTARPQADHQLYPISRPFGLEEISLPEALASLHLDRRGTTDQRLSEAVAVAGVRAAAGGRRRAVLLIVDDCARRSGRWTGAAVRRYLGELRVPLKVWTVERPDRKSGGFCSDARQLVNSEAFGAALSRLRRLLRRQQILWVQGSHLPGEIMLAESAPATEVALPN